MASVAQLQVEPTSMKQSELDRLGEDLFELAEAQLGKMTPDEREQVIAGIHATAEGLRAER